MLDSLVVGTLVLNALALALVLARGPVFGTRVYRPMLLNLGLSAAPLLVLLVGVGVELLVAVPQAPTVLRDAVLVVVALVWLLLLPNAGYLITELNLTHRRPGEHVPEWYDVLLVLVLAMSGVLNTVLNVFLAQVVWVLTRFGDVNAPFGGVELRVLAGVLLVLVSFGIWLGRNIRVNSWDAVRPWRLAAVVLRHLRTPGVGPQAFWFTVICSVFFATMYLVVLGPVLGRLASGD